MIDKVGRQKSAAAALAACDWLDASLRDGKEIAWTRDLLHGLIDVSASTQLRLFLGVVRLTAESVLRESTESP